MFRPGRALAPFALALGLILAPTAALAAPAYVPNPTPTPIASPTPTPTPSAAPSPLPSATATPEPGPQPGPTEGVGPTPQYNEAPSTEVLAATGGVVLWPFAVAVLALLLVSAGLELTHRKGGVKR